MSIKLKVVGTWTTRAFMNLYESIWSKKQGGYREFCTEGVYQLCLSPVIVRIVIERNI